MWEPVKMEDFGRIVTGKTPSSNNPEYFGDVYPFITPTDMGDGRRIGTERRISEKGAQKHKNQMLSKDSVCYVCIASIGKICMTSEVSLTNQQINSIVVNKDRHDPFFVYYLLSTYTEKVKAQAGGVATPIISKSVFEQIEAVAPPRPIQRAIAAILSAYDDLIENNERRIRILEEMAQNLYREWFVKFRFPNHQKVKLVDSPLGKIPQGWKNATLGDVCDEVRRSVDPSELPVETPYIGLEHMPRKSIALSDWATLEGVQSTKLAFKAGEILFGKIRPYFHKVGVAMTDGVSSTDAIVIVPKKPEYFSITLACVSSDDFVAHATKTSQGTKMPRANWDVLTKYPVCLPTDKLLAGFNSFVEDVVAQIRNFALRNRILRETRDLLLPRLISGELDVSELDIKLLED